MKIFSKILLAILILTALLPLNVAFGCLLNHSAAAMMIDLSSVTIDTEKIMLMLGGYIVSYFAVYALAIAWLIKNNAAGIILSLALGLITLCRGLLLMISFTVYHLNGNIFSIVMIFSGSAIIIFSVLANRKNEEKK